MDSPYDKYKTGLSLNSDQLKIIAMAIMIIDHIGSFLIPPYHPIYPLCRTIGRLAFPIFCFMIAEGARRTHSMLKYMARLVVFALISTPPYNLLHGNNWYSLEIMNVFFTLLFGLAAVFSIQNLAPWIYRKFGINQFEKSKAACIFLGLPFCVALYFAAYALNTDYGGYGVAAILIFWLLKERPLAAWGTFAIVTFICYDFTLVKYCDYGVCECVMMNPYDIILHRIWEGGYKLMFVNARQVAALLAVIPCSLYNGQRGSISSLKSSYGKYIFYAFYPVHLMIILAIAEIEKILLNLS